MSYYTKNYYTKNKKNKQGIKKSGSFQNRFSVKLFTAYLNKVMTL